MEKRLSLKPWRRPSEATSETADPAGGPYRRPLARGTTWRRGAAPRNLRTLMGAAAIGLATLAMIGSSGADASASPLDPGFSNGSAGGAAVNVIFQAAPGQLASAESAVRALDGNVGQELGIINGFAATIHEGDLSRFSALPSVRSVSSDAKMTADSAAYDPATDTGYSMSDVTTYSGARAFWKAGYTGKGVDVALIDTGITPVAGLDGRGKIAAGKDLTPDAANPKLNGLDAFGHGTFMAGLIAGHDSNLVAPYNAAAPDVYAGMAPDARLVPVKVGAADGSTDVSSVIAAIDWVVQHKNSNGLNIRIINLSFGTNTTQPYQVDPLAFAAEQAWNHGIIVVASAGNYDYQAKNGASGLSDPAYDPYIIAAGASDAMATLATSDDQVASFSATSKGCPTCKNPDLVAAGAHLQGLRVPGSYIDTNFSTGEIGTRYFRGSGTSEAAAVTSGALALILQKYQNLSPDAAKTYLTVNALKLTGIAPTSQGSGEIALAKMLTVKPSTYAKQFFVKATGGGSFELARGTAHVTRNGVTLSGEKDIHGNAIDSKALAAAEATGDTWGGDTWGGDTWGGDTWGGDTWGGDTWSGAFWNGDTWSGAFWNGDTWSGAFWGGDTWSGAFWGGDTWD